MIDSNQGKTSIWEYVNPISLASYAYANPIAASWIFRPYQILAEGRGLSLPGIFPVGRPVTISAMGEANKARKVMAALKVTGKAGAFGIEGIGAAGEAEKALNKAMWASLRGMKMNMRPYYAARMRMAVKGRNYFQGVNPEFAESIVRRMTAMPGAEVWAKAGLMFAGEVINPIMNVLAVGQTALFLGEMAYRGIQATANVIDRATERVYNLELGGQLSRGFLTGSTATERQRALQAIQSSHLSGRRMLGNEAQMVH